MTTVISDTSFPILYNKLDQLNLLRKTFDTLKITEEVADEYGEGLPSWIEVVKITNQSDYLELIKVLGRGEASSILLAEETENRHTLMNSLNDCAN